MDTSSSDIGLDHRLTHLRALPTPDRVLGLYDHAIDQCERGGEGAVSAVFTELMGAIDLQYGPIAEGFGRVHEYCLRKTREGDFRSVAWILQDLRDAWIAGRDQEG